MYLGHSIVKGEGGSPPPPFGTGGGFRLPLRNLEMAVGCTYTQVGSDTEWAAGPWDRHEGHDGMDAVGLANVATTTIPVYTPDVVIMMIGINDLLGGVSPISTTERIENVVDIVFTLRPTATIFMAEIVAVRPPWPESYYQFFDFSNITDTVPAANALLAQMVTSQRQQGRKIKFVQMQDALSDRSLYGDGVHPNATGYNMLGQVWFDQLSAPGGCMRLFSAQFVPFTMRASASAW